MSILGHLRWPIAHAVMEIKNSTFDFLALRYSYCVVAKFQPIWCTLLRWTSAVKFAYRELKKRAPGAATGSISVATADYFSASKDVGGIKTAYEHSP